MGLSDSRPRRRDGYVFPSRVARFRSLPGRVSQAPRLICPHALSPTTPEGPPAACACCFTSGFWLHLSRQAGHLRFPIEAESGSLPLRLAGSPPQSPIPLLESALVRLHAEQAIYMVNSFQFTRSTRLSLAYRPSGSGGSCQPYNRLLTRAARNLSPRLRVPYEPRPPGSGGSCQPYNRLLTRPA